MNEAEKDAIAAAHELIHAVLRAIQACNRAGFTGTEVQESTETLLATARHLHRLTEGK